MRSPRVLGAGIALLAALIIQGRASSQAQTPAPAAANDPRVGLRAGLRDAGKAIRNLELVASLPKPAGFFNPKLPAGEPTPPERTPRPAGADPDDDEDQQGRGQRGDAPSAQQRSSGLSFANSDLAFRGDHLFMGSFHGFNTYDIEDPKRARLIASVVCPGGQGDVSVHGNLLVMSVEQTRGRTDCGTQGVQAPVSAERFRGIRIFDISDVRKPKQIAAVQTCRGSHTHTLVTDPDDTANLYVYGSGTGSVRSAEELAGCSGKDPKEDPNTALFSIDVIQVPLAAPETARIVNRPRLFADPATGAISGLWPGGDHGPGTQRSRRTNQCHDVTAFPEVGLAAGACSGNGILLDISDPVHPVRLDAVTDKNFAYWHSATFNNDGSKVIFTDEWGGGTRPRCRSTDLPTWGANAIFDIVDRKLRFGSYYKLPVAQTDVENCVAHNGSIIPVPGRDIMVQAWYQGGVSVFDFTDSAHPFEIAFFDRGPIDAKQLFAGGYWS
ncbi:MAG: LVIVD repeat-containing protein, partial [Vicinamibacterales bacterium]